jgi:hypothetical protein
VQASLRLEGVAAGALTVGTGRPVRRLAPPVVNFYARGGTGAQMEYLPVEVRDPVGGLAAAVTVRPGPTTTAGIGRLGFFFESGNGAMIRCRQGPIRRVQQPAADNFERAPVRQLRCPAVEHRYADGREALH